MKVIKLFMAVLALALSGCATTVNFSELRDVALERAEQLKDEDKDLSNMHEAIIHETNLSGDGEVTMEPISKIEFLTLNNLNNISMGGCETVYAVVTESESYSMWQNGHVSIVEGEHVKGLPIIRTVTMVCNWTRDLVVIGEVNGKEYYKTFKLELPKRLGKS